MTFASLLSIAKGMYWHRKFWRVRPSFGTTTEVLAQQTEPEIRAQLSWPHLGHWGLHEVGKSSYHAVEMRRSVQLPSMDSTEGLGNVCRTKQIEPCQE
jgi:hypothetical protein